MAQQGSDDGRITRRALLQRGAVSAAVAGIPHATMAELRPVLDDASRLNPTPVARHVIRTVEPRERLVAAIRDELKAAKTAGRPVAVGAARHSMGGQSLARDGTDITLNGGALDVDHAAALYRVDAGARWADVIRTLDPLGFSPAVMQSNNDFGVGSTFCVNAHGWPVPHGPFGSTVRALRMILADGSLVTCSQSENADLFAHAMGGYGLFGIIVDLDVAMVPNLLLQPRAERMPAEQFATRFVAAVTAHPAVHMAYGRLSLTRKDFFAEALMTTFRPAPDPPALLPPARHASAMTGVSNAIYRAQIGHESMKSLRWLLETELSPEVSHAPVTRNTLMNEPVSNLANTNAWRTDILHEYFVTPDRFGDFLTVCRDIIPKAMAEFINVTLRYVDTDPTARLAYAPEPRIAAVMSFSQEMSTAGEVDMMQLTERLIDGISEIGGTFYLPYRLHARRDQVRRCYPGTEAFIGKKRELDPGCLFRNAMWATYFAGGEPL